MQKKKKMHTFKLTYSADELLHTVLRHAVYMGEMLLQVRALEFHLAQRALDSLQIRDKTFNRLGGGG